jgi:hypothetical protein
MNEEERKENDDDCAPSSSFHRHFFFFVFNVWFRVHSFRFQLGSVLHVLQFSPKAKAFLAGQAHNLLELTRPPSH